MAHRISGRRITNGNRCPGARLGKWAKSGPGRVHSVHRAAARLQADGEITQLCRAALVLGPTSSPSEKHGWRVFGGMMDPVQ